MTEQVEKRIYSSAITLERRSEGDPAMMRGYAAVFDQLSLPLGWGFREKIRAGAFAASLADDVRALWNHNPDYVLGRSTNNTLRLNEDDLGLRIEIEPPATQLAQHFMANIERGDVNQMSFLFRALDEEWDEIDGELVRTLTKVKLYEVSPVTFPAYPQTSVSVRDGSAGSTGSPTGSAFYIPEMPAQFRGRLHGNAAESARARLAVMRRRLDLFK
jgi:HK97 family phage prohead protease